MASEKDYVIVPDVEYKDGKVDIIEEADQVTKLAGLQKIKTVKAAPIISSDFFTRTGWESLYITRGSLGVIRDAALRFQITGTQDFYPMNPCFWFQKIEFYSNKGVLLQRLNSDSLWASILSMDQHQIDNWASEMGYTKQFMKRSTKLVKANKLTTFWLPLPTVFLNHLRLDMQKVEQLEIRFYSSGDGTNSAILDRAPGSTPTITLNDVSIRLREYLPDSKVSKSLDLVYERPRVRTFIDFQAAQWNQAMSASTKYYFDLDTFKHKSIAFIINVRSQSIEQRGPGNLYYVDLGDETVFDVISGSDTSILTGQSGVSGGYLKNLRSSELFNNSYHSVQGNAQYVLPFSNELQQSFHTGIVDGFLQLRGKAEKYQLTIDTTTACVNPVITLTQAGGAISAGTFRFAWRGKMTAPLAFNESAANVQTALNNLFIDEGLQFTLSAALSAGATPTLQITDQAGVSYCDLDPADLPQVILSPNAATATSVTSSLTTSPVDGFLAATYKVEIVSAFIKQILINKNGELEVMEY